MNLAYPCANLAAAICLFLREPLAQGAEGKAMFTVEQNAYRHLSEPASSQLMAKDDLAYRSVPFRPALTRRVRYRLVERLSPLPYADVE
jgi:hypothetical protein